MNGALVLVAMGIDSPARERELGELAGAVGATLAYIQGADPSLAAELDRLYAAGERTIRIARLPVGVNVPARSWLTRVVAHWLTRHEDASVVCLGREIEANDSLTSPGWEMIPGHRHHLFLCRGPRCAAKGAAETAAAVTAELAARGLGDDDVLVTQTGCMFPCNHAPVVVAHPDDRWFGPVTPTDIKGIVAAVLDGAENSNELPRAVIGEGLRT